MASKARPIAFGGMLTAVAVVIMSLGSLIPLNTYICPVICILLTRPLLTMFGKRVAGCYYGAVAILSLMLAPDREAALVYAFLGWYPLAKPALDKIKPKALQTALKILIFAAAGAAVCMVMVGILGMNEVMAEYQEMGIALTAVTVILFLVLFLLVDRLLGMPLKKRKK